MKSFEDCAVLAGSSQELIAIIITVLIKWLGIKKQKHHSQPFSCLALSTQKNTDRQKKSHSRASLTRSPKGHSRSDVQHVMNVKIMAIT